MKESVSLKDGKSGLGLPRINYEGGAKLHINYHEKEGVIEIKAEFKLL